MLSEQEKKAIKLIKQYREEIKNKNIKPIFILDTAINLITKLQKENEEKDKQIDLMEEFLGERDLGYYKNETGGEIFGIMRQYNKEDWKKYFERKATNNA